MAAPTPKAHAAIFVTGACGCNLEDAVQYACPLRASMVIPPRATPMGMRGVHVLEGCLGPQNR